MPLYEVRRKYGLWVTPLIGAQLEEFEKKVAQMAGHRHVYDARFETGQLQPGDEQLLQKAYDLLSELLNLEPVGNDGQASKSGYVLVYDHLQHILGVDRLTELRDKALENALSR